MTAAETIERCRACGGPRLAPILDLGRTPLADRLVRPAARCAPERTESLEVVFCEDCALVQITVTVAPVDLFGPDYPYYSSVSPALGRHFADSATALIQRLGLGPRHRVVEIASNDGVMLRHFLAAGIPALGIDPARGPADVARAAGIETLDTFFTRDLAETLRQHRGWSADLVLANNVLAHVADLPGFVDGIGALLAPHGRAVIEVPYVVDLVHRCAFDTIYHQHLCHFSLTSLSRLFARRGLTVLDVERLSIHGGSLRLHVAAKGAPGPAVAALLADERSIGVDRIDFYAGFAGAVERLRDRLVGLLERLRADGARIAAYGAAGKATTLLAYCRIDDRLVDYVADLNPRKWGLLMGGGRLPIVAPERILETMPTHLLLLAWNFADEIMAQQAEYRRRGGRFILPVPIPRIAGSAP